LENLAPNYNNKKPHLAMNSFDEFGTLYTILNNEISNFKFRKTDY
jgi:hypothetical protein